MKIHTGDTVVVIAGKDKNVVAKVLKAFPKKNKVLVEGVNKVVRHIPKTKERPGQKIEFEAPIHVSNVMLIDPKTKKRTRKRPAETKNSKSTKQSSKK